MATPQAPVANPTANPPAPSPSPTKLTGHKVQWNCKVETPPKDEKGYTVGEVFEWECGGPALTLKEPLKVQLPEQGAYALVLLKPLKISENSIRYQATSYRVGNIKFETLDVIDSEGRGFMTDRFELKTQSIIDPQNPPKEPYGPLAPYKMGWPMWIFFSAVVVVLVLIAWSLVFFRRRLQKNILEKNIKKFQTPLGAYHQFSKDLRALKRSFVFSEYQTWTPEQTAEFLSKLNESFRLFVLREFTVPATTWSISPILREIKRKDPGGFDKYKGALLKAFRELDRARNNIAGLKNEDCEQIAQICWLAVDLIWKTKREGAKGGQS
jgi:hypothetical protein